MMNNRSAYVLFAFLLLRVSALFAHQQVYIVYLGEHSGDKTFQEIENTHHSYLHSIKYSKEEAAASIIHSYKNAINGFSALLTPQQAHAISEMDGVVSVFRSEPARLHTTRSWDFISLLEANWDASKANGEELLKKAGYGQNVTVALIDSGIWPESESFSDTDMEPVPAYWKGTCQSGDQFNSSHCNRKIVGARYYVKGYEASYGPLDPKLDFRSPRDINGHGTHTASTVGGRRVPNAAAIGGIGGGTASGGAPLVRLAIYKVCWPIPGKTPAEGNACFDDDVLAAIDDAVADGVQVISVSIGRFTSIPYVRDAISIGALHAVKKNIVVACSAGNSGPTPSTVSNVAPWIITVAASSIDRVFSSPVKLGNGVALEGQSITPFDEAGMYPLVYAADVEIPGSTTNQTIGLCMNGTLSPDLVKGKAVFCWTGDTFETLEVARAGGIAAVLRNSDEGMGVVGRPYMIPATIILSNEIPTIYNYSASDKAATAALTPVNTLSGPKPAPFMVAFTSRGPSRIEPNILKPDITAPGLNIVAAWSEASSPLNVPADKRVVKYQFDSGTSMSCPHVSAVAALVKAIHPHWSSAAIRSALITTTKATNNQGKSITDAQGNPSNPFEFGAGHIQPSMAADPGLVYDANYGDYLLFLCGSSDNQLDPSFHCPDDIPPASHFNYPSLAIAELEGWVTVGRTVTNVGPATSSYSVTINQPAGYTVEIAPTALSFNAVGEKQTFNITVKAGSGAVKNVYAFGSFVWSDGTHQVTSPIALSKTY
ncbi:subtilisin-like protease SBT5.6 [Salvia miltiorrhiza]|uniref:subtilisin-like protease SBT5.6 n=1 Tax=Salvia miltiorrhiza TaxID=226208 RepID=UPI0025ACB948|nr:subtilisin-like protease SBT5.6 [Salvia miltiorrhiza]